MAVAAIFGNVGAKTDWTGDEQERALAVEAVGQTVVGAAAGPVGFDRDDESVVVPAAGWVVSVGVQVAEGECGQVAGRRGARAFGFGAVVFQWPAGAWGDPFLWYERGLVQALRTDMTGKMCAEK